MDGSIFDGFGRALITVLVVVSTIAFAVGIFVGWMI